MSSVRSRNRTASNITRSCSEPHQRRNVSRETFPKSPSPEEMPGRAEELSTLFEKRNRRGEHCSPETPPSSLRLATSSVEEALRNRLLFQRRCPAGQRSCSPFLEKAHCRGEHRSPETPPSSLRLATSSVEEAFSNCLLFQRRCPTGQRSRFCFT